MKGRILEVELGEVMEGADDFLKEGVGDVWLEVEVFEGLLLESGLLMLRAREAGGPTGTMREPNSTPMVTSWWGEKRPSQRRMVSYGGRWSAGKVQRVREVEWRLRTLDLPVPLSPMQTSFAM